mgnify:CR=1 FL=1
MGFNEFLSSIFGNKSTRDMKEIKPWVEKIKAAYPEIEKLDNDALRAKTEELKKYIHESATAERAKVEELKASIESLELEDREEVFAQIDKIEKEILDKYEKALDEVLPVAFSIVKATAKRFTENEEIVVTATDFDRQLAATKDFVRIEGDKAIYQNHWIAGGNDTVWNMVHYDVQLFGGVVLHKGKIAEMATGEGKTLVATLPVFLNALTGNGVHVVTVNDYLAKRDSEWMGPLYMFHGLSVDCIDRHQPNSDARRQAYLADITFGTNNEFGFDYLRDNMAISPKDLVQRQHNYAIVDEVDSVLIDDARTPLIISGPVPKGDDQLFEQLRPLVERLVEAQKVLATKYLSEAKKLIASNDKKEVEEGFLALYRSHKCLPKNKALIKFLSEQGIKAGMLKTEEIYMEQNNKRMHEVTEPLYFVIDEKLNSVDLTDKGIDLITGNSEDPTLFVLPDIAAELSELENMNLTNEQLLEKKDELLTNYAIKSERVHTINQLLKAYTMFEKDDEYVVIDGQVKIVDEQTGRIMEGRRYSDGLHQAIEAKEGVKVEAATQTFATITLQNYFRMYHKLSGMTGTAETEAGELWDIYKLDVVVIPTNRPIARKDMNDRVYKTKREKYKAVIEEIEQLVNAGRPVLVGTTSVEISEMLSKMLTMRKIEHKVLNAKLHQKEADIVATAGLSGTVTIATNDGLPVTQFNMTEIEELGLLKMDFLGLRTLTVIRDAETAVQKQHPEFSIRKLDYDDPDTYKMLGQGDTEGVFQLESSGMKQVLVGLQPQNLEDVIALISLYRPGPMDSIPTYLRNRHEPDKISYKTPQLAHILDVTNGCIVYQEQVMQIFRELAGFSFGQADNVRRAMSKKKHAVMEAEREHFVHGCTEPGHECPGCVANGIPEQVANQIYDEMSSFASYAFNKSHAACYAYVAFQTAYLKCHYPSQFMAALLTSVLDNTDKVIEYSGECARLGIKVLPPDVNISNGGFTADDNGQIRFGLNAVKNVGRNLIENAVTERKEKPYTSLYDFCKRMHGSELNRRAVESLIKAGAFDCFGSNRHSMVEAVEGILKSIETDSRRNLEGQLDLFSVMSGEVQQSPQEDVYEIRPLAEYTPAELLQQEKEVSGLYLSGHPLDAYREKSARIGSHTIKDLTGEDAHVQDGEKVRIVCAVVKNRMMTTKSNSMMAFTSVEDLTGTMEVIVFPKVLDRFRDAIQENAVVVIDGRLSVREDEASKLLADSILPIDSYDPTRLDKGRPDPVKTAARRVFIRLPSRSCPQYDKVVNLLEIFDGDIPVILYLEDTKQKLAAPRRLYTSGHPLFFKELERLLGAENVATK